MEAVIKEANSTDNYELCIVIKENFVLIKNGNLLFVCSLKEDFAIFIDIARFDLNNPYRYIDQEGEFPVDVVVDVAFVGYGVYSFVKDPSLSNLGYLGLDVGFAVVPFVPNVNRLSEAGKLVKGLDRVEDVKDVEKVLDTSSDVIKSADDLKPFTKSNFRENVLRQTGEVGIGKEAHHNLPQSKEFSKFFREAGFPEKGVGSIHDPNFGSLVEKSSHKQAAYSYNQAFKQFFKQNEGIRLTKNRILNKAREISRRFGSKPRF